MDIPSEDIRDIFEDQTKRGFHSNKGPLPSSALGSLRTRRLNWHDEADRALAGERPGAVAKAIKKVYELAEGGNLEAIKVVFERDFGKVTTPVSIDTDNASDSALLGAFAALQDGESGSTGPDS